ncbi:hypothetical protein GTO10_00610 [Candidatus Saccharibacteria bacterium]|nr:hypothetical protein [Candidatus Saccharibacteria bacterium]
MQKIAGVWQNEKEDGTAYFSGKIQLDAPTVISDELYIYIFKNQSDHEKSPAYDVLISKPKKKEGGNGKPVEL